MLVTMDERTWIAGNAVQEMKNENFTYKINDLDKMIKRIRTEREKAGMGMHIVVKPIKNSPFKTPSYGLTFQKDPITGVFYGIPNGKDQYGNPKWLRIPIGEYAQFDLNRDNDAKIWSVFRFHPSLKGSPFQGFNGARTVFELEDPGEEAKIEKAGLDQMRIAMERIDLILNKGKDLVNFARYLGENVNNKTGLSALQSAVIKYMRKDPVEFNKKWENSYRTYIESVYAGIDVGKIQDLPGSGIMYNNIPLGQSVEEAAEYLKKDRGMMEVIVHEIDKKDEVTKGIEEEIKKNKLKKDNEKEVKDNKNTGIEDDLS